MQWAYLGAFGLIGIYARYGLGLAFDGFAFPLGTLLINILGSFFAGLLYGIQLERQYFSPEIQTALLVGLLGGFTTFSAFALQSVGLAQAGKWPMAAAYVILSNGLGLLMVVLGIGLAKRFVA